MPRHGPFFQSEPLHAAFGTRGQSLSAGAGVHRVLGPVLARTPTGVAEPPRGEGGECGAIHFVSGGLEPDLAVPFEPEALQRPQDVIGRPGHLSRRVEVLHADEPLSAVVPGITVRSHRRQEAADVQPSRGRRRKAANMATARHQRTSLRYLIRFGPLSPRRSLSYKRCLET